MARRRKRADSDNDESLEQRYSSQADRVVAKDPPSLKSQDEQDRIERLRLKKKRRKELKQSKAAAAAKRKEESYELESPLNKKSQDEQNRIERLRLQKKLRKEIIQCKATAAEDKDPTSKDSKKKENHNNTFIELKKGVRYRDVVAGTGPVVQDRKKIRVAYVLRAKERFGKIIDSSNDFRFRVGRGEVIQGWDIGVLGMKRGGKRYLLVPPQAAYGQRNVGAGKGGLLFFEITVLAC
jgi:FKBP-type peptidyl-prolyl cis-trans isomerase